MIDEFSFLTAQTEADWQRWQQRNIRISEDGVTLAKEATITTTAHGFESHDFDLNPNGNLVVVTASGSVNIYVTEQETLKPLTLRGDERGGLDTPDAVGSMRTHIYVLDSDANRISAFSRQHRRHEWTAPLDIDPVTVIGSSRRVYVLHGRGDDGAIRAYSPTQRGETVFRGLVSPVDMSISPAEDLYVLEDRGDERAVVRLRSDTGRFDSERSRVQVALPDGFTPDSIGVEGEDTLLFAGRTTDGTPLLVECDLTQQTTEQFTLPDTVTTELSSGARTDKSGQIYLRTPDGDAVSVRKEFVNQKDPENTRYEGRITRRFDAGTRGEQWHRMTLDIEQRDPNTRVDINYFATDQSIDGVDDLEALSIPDKKVTELEAAGIDGLWDLIQHTPEEIHGVLPTTPEAEIETLLSEANERIESVFEQRADSKEVHDPTDMLLKDATGQYLYVQVRLVGNRNASPRLRSLRAYCPRRSYIRYLPEIYQNMSGRSEFLSHFLSIFESVFLDIEQGIGRRSKYFDPKEIPIDSLPWLNEWLAVEMGDSWPEAARRELLSRVPALYQKRGTREGLKELIQLYFKHADLPERSWERSLVHIERRLQSLIEQGYLSTRDGVQDIEQYRERSRQLTADTVYIVEYNDLDVIETDTQQRQYEHRLGHPRRFQVLLQPWVPDRHVSAVESIVESNKPVYTDAEVKTLEDRYRLGGDTYLGINTTLPTRECEIGSATLGQETILYPNQ